MEQGAHTDQSLRDVVHRVVQRRALLLSVAGAVFIGVAAWTFLATPRFQSKALLRIESRSSTPSLPDELQSLPGLGLMGLGRDELETEIGVLRSRRVADATIDSLALTVRVRQPAGDRASVVRARVLDSTDVAGRLTLTRQGDGRYRLASRGLNGLPPVPESLAPGDSLRVGGVLLTLPAALRASGPEKIRLQLLPRYKVREQLDKRLAIRREEGGSRLVEVAFEDPDRLLAAQVVGHLVQEYITYSLRTERHDAGTAVAELRGVLDRNSTRLARAEEALRAFQQREKLIVPDEQATQQVKRIAVLDGHLDAIGIERAALSRLLALIEKRSHGGSDPTAYRQLATFPSLIGNKGIQDMLAVLIDLENKRSELGVRRTETNEDYRQLSGRIVELDEQLYRLGGQYLESLDQQLSTTTRAVTQLTDTLVALPAVAMLYARLVRERSLQNEEHLVLTKQLKQTELQDLLRKERIRVVDAASVANPDDQTFPKPAVQLVLGAILAVVLALAVGLGVELWGAPTDREPLTTVA